VDIADADGRTPLTVAGSRGHEEILLELLNVRPRVDITDGYSKITHSAAAAKVARGSDELKKEQVSRSQEQTYYVSFRNIYCVKILCFKMEDQVTHTLTHKYTHTHTW
jgi:vacuolar-type H+-ATPase subunit D/Vma8